MQRVTSWVIIKPSAAIYTVPVFILVGPHKVSSAISIAVLCPVAIVRVNRTKIGVPVIIHVSGNVFAVVYRGNGNDGFIRTVEIAPDGNITNSVIDSLEYDTGKGYYPDIIPIGGGVITIAYTGTNKWHGILKTMAIATSGESASAGYEIVATAGEKTISAYVNTANETASIVSWQTE